MNFKYKCYLQSFLSRLPKGDIFNYYIQRYLAHTLPVNNEVFRLKIDEALRHYENYTQFNQVESSELTYYEFGAGSTIIIPLVMAALGFEVVCIDLKKLLRIELLQNCIERLKHINDEFPLENKFKHLNPEKTDLLNELEKQLGFKYMAPLDARSTQFSDNSFNFISSTKTFEHIPKKDVLPILNETHRILKPQGVVSLLIDYQDHWSYFDSNITVYNFLKYSPEQWKKYNPDLQFQNRLRHCDYMDIIKQTDFEIVAEQTKVKDGDLNLLSSISIADEFKNYSAEELAIRKATIVLRKN